MKSIKKFLFVMAALAAVCSFVSCSSDDDDPKTVAVYENIWNSGQSITFFDDGTFKTVQTLSEDKLTSATGTYTGDVTKDTSTDNKVTYTIKKRLGGEDLKLLSIEDWVKWSFEGVDVDETEIEETIESYKDAPATIKDGVLSCVLGDYKKK